MNFFFFLIFLINFIKNDIGRWKGFNIHDQLRDNSPSIPSKRGLFCLYQDTKLKDQIFLINGNLRLGSSYITYYYSNEVFIYDVSSFNWTKINGDSYNQKFIKSVEHVEEFGKFNALNVPKPKTGKNCIKGLEVKDDNINSILIYGGGSGSFPLGTSIFDADLFLFTDIYEFHPKNYTWRKIKDDVRLVNFGIPEEYDEKTNPGPIFQSSIVRYDESFLLFGGLYPFDEFEGEGNYDSGNLWQYCLIKNEFRWLTGEAHRPQNYSYSGRYVDQKRFSEKSYPYGRSGHSLFMFGDIMYVFGGVNNDYYARQKPSNFNNMYYFNDLWAFNVTNKWWKWIVGNRSTGNFVTMNDYTIIEREKYDERNVPRSRHSQAGLKFSETEFLIFGGRQLICNHHDHLDENCMGVRYGTLNSLWKFDIQLEKWKIIDGSDELDTRYGSAIGNDYSDLKRIDGRFSTGLIKIEDDNLFIFGGAAIGYNNYDYKEKYSNDWFIYFPKTIFSCFGYVPLDIEYVCSKHGICSSDNNCVCEKNYTNDKCDHPVCINDCNYPFGDCIEPGNCRCKKYSHGKYCENVECYHEFEPGKVCSGHGKCININTCECDKYWQNYYSKNCSEYYCDFCFRGGPNNCICYHGYSGKTCQVNDYLNAVLIFCGFVIPTCFILAIVSIVLGFLFYKSRKEKIFKGSIQEKKSLLIPSNDKRKKNLI